MRILFSISYAMNLEIQSGPYAGHWVDVVPRSSDWLLNGARKYIHHVAEAVRLLWRARHYDALVLCTTGIETFITGKLCRTICPKTRLVSADFLIPRKTPLVKLIASGLKNIDSFVCIRRGDIDTLQHRFHVPRERCSFAPFPCNDALLDIATSDQGYIYSAGWAHRDWPTLLDALSQLQCAAILSVGGDLTVPQPMRHRVRVLPQRSPEDGRRLMANATLVVLPLKETELPSGPLVLLDAMVMGKALVVSNVNGSRDYVIHGRNGFVIPTENATALATSIQALLDNPKLRKSLGDAARQDSIGNFDKANFVEAAVSACLYSKGEPASPQHNSRNAAHIL